MVDKTNRINQIKTPNNVTYNIDAALLGGNEPETYQEVSNLVNTLGDDSTDTQYPSAKLVYDELGYIAELLSKI